MSTESIDTTRLPKLVALLLEAGKREELLMDELKRAVSKNDKDEVFEIAQRIFAQRTPPPGE